ncbi:MAG: PemK family protein [Clostridiaceae bacterium]|nr:PemK family protein [Clostridiaceae bacterium]
MYYMKNLESMSGQELKEYIEETKLSISNLSKEYIDKIENKIHESKNKKEFLQQALMIKKIYKYVEWANEAIKMNDNVPNRSKVIPKRGEIWTCELGQNIGSEENKIRPVIILQNDTGNVNAPTTIVVPISNRPKRIAVHIALRSGDFILVEGEKMEITGTVLAEQIRVVSKARLGRHVATLNDKFMKLLDSKIKISLDL